MRLLNRVGDRMLAAVLPGAKAGACAHWTECRCSQSCRCHAFRCVWCDGNPSPSCVYLGPC
jgi:hypothetical protein